MPSHGLPQRFHPHVFLFHSGSGEGNINKLEIMIPPSHTAYVFSDVYIFQQKGRRGIRTLLL